MHLKHHLLFVLLLAIQGLYAQQTNQLKEFDSFVEKVLKDWNAPSAAVAIVKGDQIMLAKGYGYRDLEKKLPATENTLYAIGSSTKAMTAFALCQLVDDDLIDLDKPIIEYLPDFRMYDEYATHKMTARDLLCHRSGLPRQDLVWYGSKKNRAEIFDVLGYLEPTTSFRSAFQYQNLMFMTAGYLTGQLKGSSWEGVLMNKIFKPLGMDRTNCSIDASRQDADHAIPYAEKKPGEIAPIPFRNIDAVGPAGSVNSSAREMANWLLVQTHGGSFNGIELLSASVHAQTQMPTMIVPQSWTPFLAYENNDGPVAYGLGWFISTHKGHKVVEHGGTIDGFRTSVGMLPADSIGIAVMVNLAPSNLPQTIRNYAFDLLLGEEPTDWNQRFLDQREKALNQQKKAGEEQDQKRKKDTQPSHPLTDYTGSFEHPAYGQITFNVEEDGLQVTNDLFNGMLEHYHYDVFQLEDPQFGKVKFTFHNNTDGEVNRISSQLEPTLDHEIFFERMLESKVYTIAQLQGYTGEYALSGITMKVGLRGKKSLTLNVPGQPAYELVPVGDQVFQFKNIKGYSARFEKDDYGNISALILDQPNGVFTAKRKKQ